MGNYVTNENPIIFLPKLAEIIGINESIILSLIHFWINPDYNKNFKNSRYWVYNTYEQWQKQLPHLSVSTIKRTITKLEKQSILISQSFSNNPYIKLKWYSINYEVLHKLLPSELIPHHSSMHSDIVLTSGKKITLNQSEHTERSDCADRQINLTRSYIKTKTTTKKTNNLISIIDSEIQNSSNDKNAHLEEKYVIEREMINIWNKVFKNKMVKVELEDYAIKLLQFSKKFFSTDLNLWEDYCNKISSSKFLMGEGANKWKASFNWATKEETIRKVLGGYYTLGDRIEEEVKSLHSKRIEEEPITDPIWRKVTEKLKISLGKDVHTSWTAKLKYKGCENKTVHLIAPSSFIKQRIIDNYSYNLIKAFEESGVMVNKASIISANTGC